VTLPAHELALTFLAGVAVGLLSYEVVVHPWLARRARIWRRLR
jgi:hypothetical protein